jgi:hypothetical protein
MFVLGRLKSDEHQQYELFQDRPKIESIRRIADAVDAINEKYGRHTVCLATGLFLNGKPESPRDATPARRSERWPGEDDRRRVALPRMEICV